MAGEFLVFAAEDVDADLSVVLEDVMCGAALVYADENCRRGIGHGADSTDSYAHPAVRAASGNDVYCCWQVGHRRPEIFLDLGKFGHFVSPSAVTVAGHFVNSYKRNLE